MNTLTGTSDVIRLKLNAAHTTTAPSWITASKILTVATGALGGLVRKFGVANGASYVTIVDSPTADQDLQTNSITVFNLDTVSHTVTIECFDGATATQIKSATLATGQQLEYSFQLGKWTVYSAAGLPISDTGTPGSDGTDGADGAAGALTVSEAEIDFGTKPVREKTFTVANAGVAATSEIIAGQSGRAATGRDADENEMDWLILNCKPETGQFIVNAIAIPGPVTGKFKINYQFS